MYIKEVHFGLFAKNIIAKGRWQGTGVCEIFSTFSYA